jgi:hypothetical protein
MPGKCIGKRSWFHGKVLTAHIVYSKRFAGSSFEAFLFNRSYFSRLYVGLVMGIRI